MPRLPKNKQPRHFQSHRELQIMFYQAYNESHLYHKGLALCYSLNEPERFREFVQHPDVTGVELIDSRWEDGLRAELFFTFMHQFESYFALLRSPYQDKPEWIYLAHYDPGDVEKWAKAFVDKDMEKLTGNPSLTRQQFVQDALYLGTMTSEPEQAPRWSENLNTVVWLLERTAGKYLAGLDAYNAHKHGLRTMTGTAILSITRQDESGRRRGVGWDIMSDDTLTYLTWQPAGPDTVSLAKVTKLFSPKECFFYLTVLTQMAETTKTTRLAALRGDTSPQPINTFFDLDRQQVLQYSEIREWTIPI